MAATVGASQGVSTRARTYPGATGLCEIGSMGPLPTRCVVALAQHLNAALYVGPFYSDYRVKCSHYSLNFSDDTLTHDALFVLFPVEYWIFQQKGKAKITPERIQILESIGFEWDPQKVQWESMYDKLQDFVRQHGHAKVPKGFTQNPELANWVRNQRLEHRNWQQQKRSRMTQERFALLDKLGFVWSQSSSSSSSPTSKPGATQAK